MAEKTAGKELQKGFIIIISIMILTCVVGFVSIFLMKSSIVSIQENLNIITTTHQPLIQYTELINAHSLEAELGLMRYIAEYDKDTAVVSAQVKRLIVEIDKATAFAIDNPVLKDKLVNMSVMVKKMEKTIRMVSTAETWEQKDELVNSSFKISEKMTTMASEIKEATYKDIEKKLVDIDQKNKKSTFTSNVAEIILIITLILAIISIIIIKRMWSNFQEMILDL